MNTTLFLPYYARFLTSREPGFFVFCLAMDSGRMCLQGFRNHNVTPPNDAPSIVSFKTVHLCEGPANARME